MNYLSRIFVAFLLMLLFLSLQKCRKIEQDTHNNYIVLTDTVTYYKNRLKSLTASVTALQMDKKTMKKVILSRDKELEALCKEFSQLKSVIKYKGNVLIDSIPVKYTDTVPYSYNRSGTIASKWYKFAWQSNQLGFTVDSLLIPTQTTIVTGIKKKWFLGSQKITTDITNNNPYLKVTAISSTELIVTQPWYKKWYLWLAAGIAAGTFAAR